ncbi:MAG TPA: helix-turn-helix domain-containing protein [Solirubrobacteraceae bacterium]|jgi:AcrR family transcriptional regulator|nr:helix-turn-helix domain-containing protein [Solirubrobacteraceae bacterium]
MTSKPAIRADARRNRDAAIDAAVELLARKPDASMLEVADAAELGRTTLYRHFPAREDLLLAIFERIFEEARAITAAALAAGGTPADVLRRVASEIVAIGARYRFLEAHRGLSQRVLEQSRNDDEPLMEWIRDAHARGELAPELTPEWIFQMTIALAMQANEEVYSGTIEQELAVRLLGETLVRAFVR